MSISLAYRYQTHFTPYKSPIAYSILLCLRISPLPHLKRNPPHVTPPRHPKSPHPTPISLRTTNRLYIRASRSSGSSSSSILTAACVFSQITVPLHSLHALHLYFIFPWTQIAEPPQSLQMFLNFPCPQKADPPHCLQYRRSLPCSQIPGAPQSLQRSLLVPCSQIDFPPQSLQRDFLLPCSHMHDPTQSLQ